MFTINKRVFKTVLFLVLPLFILASCDIFSNDHDDDHDEGHEEAYGIVIYAGQTEVARQMDGEVTYPDGTAIRIPEGETTSLMTVKFLEADHSEFTPDDGEDFLAWEIANESVADAQAHESQPWGFYLTGVAEGSTTITFQLMHGSVGSAHPDWESLHFDLDVYTSEENQNGAVN